MLIRDGDRGSAMYGRRIWHIMVVSLLKGCQHLTVDST